MNDKWAQQLFEKVSLSHIHKYYDLIYSINHIFMDKEMSVIIISLNALTKSNLLNSNQREGRERERDKDRMKERKRKTEWKREKERENVRERTD